MVRKKVKKGEDRFTNIFVKESDVDNKRKAFLTEYLSLAEDEYMSKLLKKLLSHGEVSSVDRERIDDLMRNVDLSVLYVEQLLRDDEEGEGSLAEPGVATPMSDVERRIMVVMDAGKGRLTGWDEKFIYGDTGAALLNQAKNRGGWLSEKQIKQVSRIENILGV